MAGNEKYNEFRKSFPDFIYKNYKIEYLDSKIKVTFYFIIPGLIEFSPMWEFPCRGWNAKDKSNNEALERLIFSLGMVELISYWKVTCSPTITILCGNLNIEQMKWWKNLYYNGLGEFFYINEIDQADKDNFMQIQTADGLHKENIEPIVLEGDFKGCLVPIGGGKDSVVSLEILHEMKESITTFSINRIRATKEVIDLCTYKEDDILVKRTLDKGLLDLNAKGYLNGHTPFSAIVAFSSVIEALLSGKQFITLSNETSANESTVKDSDVNHQYSKSYLFEKDFRGYIKTLIESPITYFSLLRPLTEMQIAKIFAKAVPYHFVFRSCNEGSKQGIWCLNCSKCLFVYIILAPFLKEEELVSIFGENLLDKKSLEVYFRELTGLNENKPFECVGTRSEVLTSLKSLCMNKEYKLPYLIEKYKDYIMENGGLVDIMNQEWCEENELLPKFEEAVRRSIS